MYAYFLHNISLVYSFKLTESDFSHASNSFLLPMVIENLNFSRINVTASKLKDPL